MLSKSDYKIVMMCSVLMLPLVSFKKLIIIVRQAAFGNEKDPKQTPFTTCWEVKYFVEDRGILNSYKILTVLTYYANINEYVNREGSANVSVSSRE